MENEHGLSLETRTGLPDAPRVLAEQYPRTDWEAHENFGEMIQFWIQRHLMFRQLTDVLRVISIEHSPYYRYLSKQ